MTNGDRTPIGSQFRKYHSLYIKIDDFKLSTKLVAGEHMTNPPATIIYVSIDSSEVVHSTLIIAELNGVEVKMADV